MPEFWSHITSGFMPHGYCLRWDPALLFVFILGNAGIAIAYFMIPLALRYFIGKRADLPYSHMFKLFAVFILSCGITHLMKVWTLYQPAYWIEALADLWTAAVSLLTAILLLPLIPKMLALRSPAELEVLNRTLSETNLKLSAAQQLLNKQVDEGADRLEQALGEVQISQQEFSFLFDMMPQLAWTAQPDGFIDFYNKGWYEYTGTTYESMQGWGWEAVQDANMLPAVKKRWQESIDSKIPFEMEFPLKGADGVFRWFLTRAKPNIAQNGAVTRWVGINTDIDERKRSSVLLEQRVSERTAALEKLNNILSESERKFRAIFDHTFELIGLLSTDGMVLEVNNSALEFQGIQANDVLGKLFWETAWFNHSEELQAKIKDAVKQAAAGKFVRMETSHITASGPAFVDFSLKPVFDDASKVVLLLPEGRDISDRKRTESELKQLAEKLATSNRDLEQFAYVASHDLQEPLRTVISFADLLVKRCESSLDSDAKKYLGVIVDSTTRMQQLIRDLLLYSQIETRGNEFEPIELSRPINDALKALTATIEESHTEVLVGKNAPIIRGDAMQLSLVFQNLISNAIKFRGSEPVKIEIKFAQSAIGWKVSVVDNGIGMSMEYAERIFIIFQRLHPGHMYPGTGIGLAVCKRVVERHGGDITVQSVEGQGSTFSFTLPLYLKDDVDKLNTQKSGH
ncbi:hypothetical protein BH11CYA1_BH11CYA1_22480 [soil metagenome]